WPVTHGEGINVVIIDTGIDYTHPDLSAVYAGGLNTFGNTDDPKDDNGHGTHVAGTIAAADNAVGVVGVAPHVKLWSVKVLNIADFSNQGQELAVVAPGVDVLSTYLVGQGSSAGAQSNAGVFPGAEVELSKRGTVNAEFVNCGLGNPGDFPSGVAGKIAVIKR